MRRIVFNQKGGVGKTSISCNLAAISAARGFKTLIVDLDIQGNATHYLIGKVDEAHTHTHVQSRACAFAHDSSRSHKRLHDVAHIFGYRQNASFLHALTESPICTNS